MTYTMKPLSFAPDQLTGLSERLIVSHYEDNYRGAVHMGYGAKAMAYVDAFMQNIHWDNVAKHYASIRHPSQPLCQHGRRIQPRHAEQITSTTRTARTRGANT